MIIVELILNILYTNHMIDSANVLLEKTLTGMALLMYAVSMSMRRTLRYQVIRFLQKSAKSMFYYLLNYSKIKVD